MRFFIHAQGVPGLVDVLCVKVLVGGLMGLVYHVMEQVIVVNAMVKEVRLL